MDQRCYWPDATITSDKQVPCTNITASGTYTACCDAGHYCFSNGLCLDNGGMTTYRGGCTDRSWESPDCPRYCQEVCPGSVCGLWPCDGTGHFACEPSKCGSQQIIIPAGNIVVNAALHSALSVAESSTMSTTSATSSSEATHSPTTTIATTLPSSNATCDVSLPRCDSTRALAGVGAGIGVPLSIALVIVSVLLFREKRRKHGYVVDGREGSDPKEAGTHSGGLKWLRTSSYRNPGFPQGANSTGEQIQELGDSQITRIS